ncbi:MAG TPA: copper-translocating P-type ATPase, partial [Chlamydiales bacterium]|nr:copper-translocating P-type ATPase [Chlamydiales bacterium]
MKKVSSKEVLFVIAALIALPFLVQMVGVWELSHAVQWILASITQFICGFPFYYGSFSSLKKGSMGMDVLVALGTTAAYGYSVYGIMSGGHLYFETSAVLIALILLGRVLEARSKMRARAGMQALLRMQEMTAMVKRDDQFVEVPIDQLKIDDLVHVKPGKRMPVDGVVVSGNSAVDEAFLTGESAPVVKEVGAQIFAGSINGNGILEVKAQRLGSETALGRIIKLVEEAQKSKAPIQRLADRISNIFVPGVLGVALLTFLVWWIMGLPGQGLMCAVAALVIACPCALGLATPMVVIVATAKGAEMGILIKDAASLEQASKLKALVVDKTGTVTMGKLSITQVSDETFLPQAKALAQLSDHPASMALTEYTRELPLLEVTHFVQTPGKGVEGEINGVRYILGSAAFSIEHGVNLDATTLGDEMSVLLSSNGHILSIIAFEDHLREGSGQAVAEMKDQGIETYLISGDREAVVAKVARELKIEHYFAAVLPEDKSSYVEKLKSQGMVTGMVGDGVNDAPAMANATVGIAM